MPTPPRLLALAAATVLAAIPGCGGSGDGDSGERGTVVVRMTDAPLDDLDSVDRVEVDVSEVVLFFENGASRRVFPAPGGTLAPITLDLEEIARSPRAIAVARIPAGDLVGARVRFGAVRAFSGEREEAVRPAEGSFRVDFASPFAVEGGRTTGLLLDLDGPASLSRGAGSIELRPAIFAVGGDDRLAIGSIAGRVVERRADGFLILVDGSDPARDALPVDLGEVAVLVGPGTTVLVDGAVITGTAGMGAIVTGERVEVSGVLGERGIAAERVVIDRAGAVNPFRVQGTVLAVDGFSFDLLVQGIRRDEEARLPFGVGQNISVAATPGTLVTRRGATGLSDIDDVLTGQEVVVEGILGESAFNVASLEVLPGRFTGRIRDVDAASARAFLEVESLQGIPVSRFEDFAVVGVDLSGSEVRLEPSVPLPISSLAGGRQVEVMGILQGSRELQASRVTVNGLEGFRARPIVIDAAAGSFQVQLDGATRGVLLDPASRLAFRRISRPDLIINVGVEEFLDRLSGADSPVDFRGGHFLESIHASVAILETP